MWNAKPPKEENTDYINEHKITTLKLKPLHKVGKFDSMQTNYTSY